MPKNNLRTRFWRVVSYPPERDSPNLDYSEILARLCGRQCYWSFILHDKDVDENGALMKPHYHWILEFKAPIGLDMLCRIFNVNVALPCRPDINLDYRYLLHLDDTGKYQYCQDDIKTNLVEFQLVERLSFSAIASKAIDPAEMYDALTALAYGDMTYKAFYSLFPSMIYKANVVNCILEQIRSDGSKPYKKSRPMPSYEVKEAQRLIDNWRSQYINNEV